MEIATKTAWELANQFVNCRMNCDIEHNPTKLLRLLGPKHNDIISLRNYFVQEKTRLDAKGKHDFTDWYDADVITILDELIDEVERRKSSALNNNLVGGFIVTALKEGSSFRKFKWDNYDILAKENLFTLFPDFVSDFRGDIMECHKVGGKYVVIETQEKKRMFYSTEIRHEKLCMTSNVWHTFEEALFHTMCPSQYSAMSILFNSQKD